MKSRWILFFIVVCGFVVNAVSQSEPRRFYRLDVVERSSPSLEVFAAPSINDFGDVAFGVRRTPGGGSVFLGQIGQPSVDLMPGLSGNSSNFVGGRVQINDSRRVIQHSFISGTTPAQNFLRRIEDVGTFTIIAAANGAGGFNDFDQIYAGSISINNLGNPVYVTRLGSNTTILTTGVRPTFATLQFPSTGDSLKPMISDCGDIVVRAGAGQTDPIVLYSYDLTESQLIASTADGFTSLGQSPAISNFCEVVTFYGELNAAGAETLGTNPGPGIFASIEIDKEKGTRRIVRLAGRLIEDISAPGGNDDGWCDPGETCIPGELGFTTGGTPIVFNTFDQLNRVAVTHQEVGAKGIEDDIFVVSFQGAPNVASDNPNRPFSDQSGLWTVTTQIKNVGGVLRERPNVPVPVVQVGDVVDGRTVNSINVYDPLAGVLTPGSTSQSPGDHRLAFHLATNNGNLIVRAKRQVEVPVIFIPGVAGSELAECVDASCSSFTRRWPAGMNAANYPHLSLAPGQAANIKALDAVRRIDILGFPAMKVYENILNELTTGSGGLTEYLVENNPERRTGAGCDLSQAVKQPNLFIFAYDWRKSNSENSDLLHQYVQCVQRFYPETEVDIVAHSMGGLLARNYILEYPQDHNVRKMVTIGSPFLGAPKALKILEDGSFLEAWQSGFTAIRGLQLNSANRIFRGLVPHFKGPHELLPSEKYLELGGIPFAEKFDFNNDGVIDAEGYDYFDLRSTFNSRFSTLPYETNQVFHEGAQDDWRNDSTGVEYVQIFGRQRIKNTPEQIVATKRLLLPGISRSTTKFEVIKDFGDKTVPVLSAERIGNNIDLNAPGVTPQKFEPRLDLGESDKDVEHNGLTSNVRVLQRVLEILGIATQSAVGSESHQGKEEEMSPNGTEPEDEANYLVIEGDVERLVITDDLGRTNTEINENFELAIPDVSYDPVYLEGEPSGFYSHDLTLPTNRQYTIRFRTENNAVSAFSIEMVQGIGNISPNLAIRYIDLVLPPNVECLLTVNAQGMEDLRYDSNGDGTYDVVVPAHVRVTGTAAQDVTAPAVGLTYSKRSSQGRTITINAADSESGVQTVYYRIGETGPYQIYTGTFFLHLPTA